MGFLSILRGIRSSENEVRVLIVGLDCSGKTTIVGSLLERSLTEIAPTLGFNIDTWKPPGKDISVALWDVGGQQTIRTYWRNYFSATDALIWVIDSTDRRRVNICHTALKEILHAEKLQGCPVLLLCNKQDVPSALTPEEIQSLLTLPSLCKNRLWRIFSCSAIQRTGIDEAFTWLVEQLEAQTLAARIDDDDLETAAWK
ncbi:ADP-Ribosylation Factor like protein 2b [Giardia muris]|uniref:ADP-Ribosylation Factor like protein 2b n=1 Tax=Giardia muris TaxID=5742 RepID=A0A4Z1SWY8_GIAMU|nr:ADP-Ribosylation Factor like protein 2b [Giardia muris]|eukprot:TNJ30236.1 ADP-Ribosylation Factor like protein 2b [Giardia muris]